MAEPQNSSNLLDSRVGLEEQFSQFRLGPEDGLYQRHSQPNFDDAFESHEWPSFGSTLIDDRLSHPGYNTSFHRRIFLQIPKIKSQRRLRRLQERARKWFKLRRDQLYRRTQREDVPQCMTCGKNIDPNEDILSSYCSNTCLKFDQASRLEPHLLEQFRLRESELRTEPGIDIELDELDYSMCRPGELEGDEARACLNTSSSAGLAWIPATNPTGSTSDPRLNSQHDLCAETSPQGDSVATSRERTSEESDSPEEELTESDDSSSSSVVFQLVHQYRQQVIDCLMSDFRLLMDQSLGIRNKAPCQGSSRSSLSQCRSTSQQPTEPSRKDKRKRDEPDDCGRDNEDGSGEGLKRPLLETPSSNSTQKLACPYYRRNPYKHRKHRSCAGPGWTSVHRVKEHVYRQHELSMYCARCRTTFRTESQLTAHQRLPQVCEIQNIDLPEGFTKVQEKLLRRRQKTSGREEDKWKDMYKVLFPDDDDDTIPTPYYNDESQVGNWESRREEEFDQFEQFLRRELPRVVKRRLEEAVAQIAEPYESHLRGQLVDIVRDSQSQLIRAYRQDSQLKDVSEANSKEATKPISLEVEDPRPILDLSAFVPPPLVPDCYSNALADNMQSSPPCTVGTLQKTSDSGYVTNLSNDNGSRTDERIQVDKGQSNVITGSRNEGYLAPDLTNQKDILSMDWLWHRL